jgi:histone H3/H4
MQQPNSVRNDLRAALQFAVTKICVDEDDNADGRGGESYDDESLASRGENYRAGHSQPLGRAKMHPTAVLALSELLNLYVSCCLSQDLAAFCLHAGRKTIHESDVLLVARKNESVVAALREFCTRSTAAAPSAAAAASKAKPKKSAALATNKSKPSIDFGAAAATSNNVEGDTNYLMMCDRGSNSSTSDSGDDDSDDSLLRNPTPSGRYNGRRLGARSSGRAQPRPAMSLSDSTENNGDDEDKDSDDDDVQEVPGPGVGTESTPIPRAASAALSSVETARVPKGGAVASTSAPVAAAGAPPLKRFRLPSCPPVEDASSNTDNNNTGDDESEGDHDKAAAVVLKRRIQHEKKQQPSTVQELLESMSQDSS